MFLRKEGENNVFELLVVILFVWLSVKAVGLILSLTWGAAKVLATILCIIALPALIICLLCAGGIVLLLPLALIAGVVGVLDACT